MQVIYYGQTEEGPSLPQSMQCHWCFFFFFLFFFSCKSWCACLPWNERRSTKQRKAREEGVQLSPWAKWDHSLSKAGGKQEVVVEAKFVQGFEDQTAPEVVCVDLHAVCMRGNKVSRDNTIQEGQLSSRSLGLFFVFRTGLGERCSNLSLENPHPMNRSQTSPYCWWVPVGNTEIHINIFGSGMGPLKTAKVSDLGFGISFRSLLSCLCCPMARYARSLSRYLTYLVSYFTYAYTGLWSGFAWPSEGSDALKVPEKLLICWYEMSAADRPRTDLPSWARQSLEKYSIAKCCVREKND